MALLAGEGRTRLLNKVPEVTIFFWIIKIMATTVGETAADYLNFDMGLGLSATSWTMAGLLVVVLAIQLAQGRYVPWIYWLTVVLISIVGTLITDSLVDNMGVSLETTTTVFAGILAVVFAAWYFSERTLSIHTIFTKKREVFYWAAILFTFALGTAAGDLAAEGLGWGYLQAALIFGGMIALVTLAYYAFRLDAVLAFWVAYILTRPLGASLGDLMSQSPDDGGLGWGSFGINAVFLVTIVCLVAYLTWSGKDRPEPDTRPIKAKVGPATLAHR